MEVLEGVFCRSELQSLLVNELNLLGVTPTMQDIKESLVMVLKVGFQAARMGIVSTFFCFLEMASMHMTHQGTLKTILMKSFNRMFYSDSIMNKLEETIIDIQV